MMIIVSDNRLTHYIQFIHTFNYIYNLLYLYF